LVGLVSRCPAGIITLTKRLNCRISRRPIGLPIRWDMICTCGAPIGQAQVLANTSTWVCSAGRYRYPALPTTA